MLCLRSAFVYFKLIISIAESFTQNEVMPFTFGSEAANLEYSILSAILGNPSPPDSSATPPQDLQYSRWSSDPIDLTSNLSPSYAESQITVQQSDPALTGTNGNSTHYLTYPFPSGQRPTGPTELGYSAPYSPQTTAVQQLQGRSANDCSRSPPISFQHSASNEVQPRGLFSLGIITSPGSIVSISAAMQDMPASKWQGINDRVIVPYDYTEGYHFLMKHLPTRCVFPCPKTHFCLSRLRFEKNDILRIVRALAIFRPSLIALQMPLSLDDEIFVEKCFQRSLLVCPKFLLFRGHSHQLFRSFRNWRS
jgi:hypothetical protein